MAATKTLPQISRVRYINLSPALNSVKTAFPVKLTTITSLLILIPCVFMSILSFYSTQSMFVQVHPQVYSFSLHQLLAYHSSHSLFTHTHTHMIFIAHVTAISYYSFSSYLHLNHMLHGYFNQEGVPVYDTYMIVGYSDTCGYSLDTSITYTKIYKLPKHIQKLPKKYP